MSCKETDEVSTPGSQFVVINTLDSHTNFSLYDYPTDNLNERFYTTDSETSVFGANRKGNHIYIATDFFTPGKTLRKVDITAGSQVKSVETWFSPAENKPCLIDFGATSVILCAMDNSYRLHIKKYDENLSLVDSLIQQNVTSLASIKVANEKLFIGAPLFDNNFNPTGFFIRVVDLNSMNLVKDIKTTELCSRFISMNNNQLWISQGNNFAILDTETLEISNVAKSASTYTAPDVTGKIQYTIQNGYPSNALIAYNLDNGESSEIAKISRDFSNPIAYDEKAQAIVCSGGANGGLVIFSKDGKILRQVKTPPHTSFICIK